MSTTSSTTIKSIQAFLDVNEETKDILGTRQVIGNFQSVKVTRQIACQMCKTDIKETDSKDQIIRCSTCKFKQLKEGLEATLSILGSIGEDDEKKSINYQAIKVFTEKENLTELLNDTDALEDFLIFNKLTYTISSSEVIQITR